MHTVKLKSFQNSATAGLAGKLFATENILTPYFDTVKNLDAAFHELKESISSSQAVAFGGMNSVIQALNINSAVGDIGSVNSFINDFSTKKEMFDLSIGVAEKMLFADTIAGASLKSIGDDFGISRFPIADFIKQDEMFRAATASLLDNTKLLHQLEPPLTRFIGNEYFNEALFCKEFRAIEYPPINANIVREDQKEELVLVNEIYQESEVALNEGLSKNLHRMWRGSVEALESKNPDKIRQSFTSARELFTILIHEKAPDSAVKVWTSDPEFYYNGRPTRKARLLYIARGIVDKEYKSIFELDIDLILKAMDILNKNTHVVDPSSDEDERFLKAFLYRCSGSLAFILGVDLCNK